MKKTILLTLLGLLVVFNLYFYLIPIHADLMIEGKMYGASIEEGCVAVRETRIMMVGPCDQLKDLIGDKTRKIKLKKTQILTPGFVESHGHFLSLGQESMNVDVSDCKDEEEFLKKISARVKSVEKGSWIFVQG